MNEVYHGYIQTGISTICIPALLLLLNRVKSTWKSKTSIDEIQKFIEQLCPTKKFNIQECNSYVFDEINIVNEIVSFFSRKKVTNVVKPDSVINFETMKISASWTGTIIAFKKQYIKLWYTPREKIQLVRYYFQVPNTSQKGDRDE